MIIETTKLLIRKNGIMNLATIEIAKSCEISHGSIFQHFGTRETLINIVLEEEIKRIAVKLEGNCNQRQDKYLLLERYIEILVEEDEFLTVLYKELPFLAGTVQRNVISMEAIIRNDFFTAIKAENPSINDREIAVGLDAFFAMVGRILTLKELYSGEENVIAARKGDLETLFEMMFK